MADDLRYLLSLIGSMIFARAFLLFLILVCAGCGNATGRRDRAELESGAAKQAAKLAKAGKGAAAADVLNKALEEDGRAARLHLELAILLHESEKDYLGAAFHYRKYLELRPDSEKRQLIESRIRVAKQMLAAGVVGTENVSAVSIQELERKNAALSARVRQLERDLRSARASRPLTANSAATNGGATTGASSGAVSRGGFRHYTVRGGDSLSSIAIKMYNDANKWEEIYEANRKELENSNDLKVGQVLIIP